MSTTDRLTTPAWVVHDAKQDFQLQEIVLADPRDDELVIEMKYSGICHTDLAVQQGFIPVTEYPTVLGHEGAGIIRSIGPKVQDKTLHVGDFVLLSVNSCQACKLCKRGYPVECLQGTRLHFAGVRDDGSTSALDSTSGERVNSHFFGQSSFQRWSHVHETCVVKHPYPAEEAAKFAPMGCGYQTGAGTILNVLKPEPDSSLVVFGLGAVGLTAVMAAKFVGVERIIAVDIEPRKLPIARDLGATHVLNPNELSVGLVDRLRELTDGQGCDYAVDCTGAPSIIKDMLECLAMRGTAVTLGVPPETADIPVNPLRCLMLSKRYLSSQGGDSTPSIFIPQLVEMNRRGDFPVEKLVKVYNYKDLPRALQDLKEGNVIKPVIQWF